jgi:hypothetical protein
MVLPQSQIKKISDITQQPGKVNKSMVTQEDRQNSAALEGDQMEMAIYPSDNILLPDIQRLIFLLPDQEVDEVKISKKIRSLALPGHHEVLLVTLVNDPDYETSARRQQMSISSLVRDPRFKLESMVVPGKSWIKLVQRLYCPGDLIVCPAEEMILTGISRREFLYRFILSRLNLPVYIYSGFYQSGQVKWIQYLRGAVFWTVMMAIFVLFFIFETRIVLTTKDWASQVVALLVVFLEAGAIYLWNVIAG